MLKKNHNLKKYKKISLKLKQTSEHKQMIPKRYRKMKSIQSRKLSKFLAKDKKRKIKQKSLKRLKNKMSGKKSDTNSARPDLFFLSRNRVINIYCRFLFSIFVDHIFSATPLRYVKARLSHATGGWGLSERPDLIVVCRE